MGASEPPLITPTEVADAGDGEEDKETVDWPVGDAVAENTDNDDD